MKFADLIYQSRDGVARPASEQSAMRYMLRDNTCAECGQRAICQYDIQVDKYYCSDECRAINRSPEWMTKETA